MKGVLLLMLVTAASGRMAGKLPGGFRVAPGFSCQQREYGFYADVENRCKAYHVCEPVVDELEQLVEMAHYTFLCGQDTIFDQEQLACAHPEKAFPCTDSPGIYESSNLPLRIQPEEVVVEGEPPLPVL